MDENTIARRFALLRTKGGSSAAGYWILRKGARLDVYNFYARHLANTAQATPLPEGHRSIILQSDEDLSTCDPKLLRDLDSHCGMGVSTVVTRGGCIYAIVCGNELISQLKIERRVSHVDMPLPMIFQFGERDAFLSFLYTAPDKRHSGWSKTLVALVCADLACKGHAHCICHVQSTNVLSIRTFLAMGWTRIGVLVTTTGGRLVRLFRTPASALSRLEISVTPEERSAT
jgi:hypothetical protein